MRLLADQLDEHHARFFSAFLTERNIYNLCERSMCPNDSTIVVYRIWTEREEQIELAKEWYSEFKKNPDAFKLQHPIAARQKKDVVELSLQKQKGTAHPTTMKPLYFGPITVRIIFLCMMLFFSSVLWQWVAPSINPFALPLSFSPIEKELLYDYPKVAQQYEEYLMLQAKQPSEVSSADISHLLAEINQMPYWQSFYSLCFQQMQQTHFSLQQLWQSISWPYAAEKIRQGQLWRLITPCFLHHSFIHLVFNMLWLLTLGGQVEERLSSRRFVLLLALLAIVSNSLQYFMGGWNFVGISGVVTGLVGFIWTRQRTVAREAYPLERSVIYFIFLFIAIGLVWELYTFFGSLLRWPTFPLGIANTAHITGACAGIALAQCPFFKKNKDPIVLQNNKVQ